MTFESFSTVPEYAPLRTAVAYADWPGVEAGLAAMSPAQAGWALTKLGELGGVEQLLESAVEASPPSPWAVTALAARYITIGWMVRSSKHAQHVSRAQFETFHQWLQRAEELLLWVFAAYPTFGPAWHIGLISARGLQLPKEEAWARYRRLEALSPNDLPAQCQMLQFILPKWFGSDPEATAFVREVVARAPAGSNSGALVALHEIERWAASPGKDGAKHMKRSDVRDSLRAAGAHSVLVPGHPLDAIAIQANNFFAMAYWLGEHKADLATHLRIIDGRAAEFPWQYAGIGVGDLEAIRQKALGKP
jgi:hypothetical protein